MVSSTIAPNSIYNRTPIFGRHRSAVWPDLVVFGMFWSKEKVTGRSRPGTQTWSFFRFCQNLKKIGAKWLFYAKLIKNYFSKFFTLVKNTWSHVNISWSFCNISKILVVKLVVFGNFLPGR